MKDMARQQGSWEPRRREEAEVAPRLHAGLRDPCADPKGSGRGYMARSPDLLLHHHCRALGVPWEQPCSMAAFL